VVVGDEERITYRTEDVDLTTHMFDVGFAARLDLAQHAEAILLEERDRRLRGIGYAVIDGCHLPRRVDPFAPQDPPKNPFWSTKRSLGEGFVEEKR
jgi:hypothetical protein